MQTLRQPKNSAIFYGFYYLHGHRVFFQRGGRTTRAGDLRGIIHPWSRATQRVRATWLRRHTAEKLRNETDGSSARRRGRENVAGGEGEVAELLPSPQRGIARGPLRRAVVGYESVDAVWLCAVSPNARRSPKRGVKRSVCQCTIYSVRGASHTVEDDDVNSLATPTRLHHTHASRTQS